MNRTNFAAIGAIIAWFALLGQYYLIIENRAASVAETTVRYFSYFTILTNIIVAVFFTAHLLGSNSSLKRFFQKPGIATAVTLYITIVGLVYQFVLRQSWNPQGLQKIIDELLHSVVPAVVIIYWFLYEDKTKPQWKQVPAWLIYPALYLVFILIRGAFSGFYPYFFVDVANAGYPKVMVNSCLLLLAFSCFAALFVVLAKAMAKRMR